MSLFLLQIATAFSWILSVINFIVSTIYLDDFIRTGYKYDKEDALLFVILVSVWASCFKVGTTTVMFRSLESAWKLWCKMHAGFFIISAITFIVAMVGQANLIGGSIGAAFVGFSAIDFIFSFIATFAVYILGRQDSFSDVLT